MYANTTSHQPTHFIRAVELIDFSRRNYQVPSENWPYPTSHRLGDPRGQYYAEVWVDGMDWQPSYWLIETHGYRNPICLPLMIFEDHKYRDMFSVYTLSSVMKALMQYRQDILWVKHGEQGYHNEEIWPYFHPFEPAEFRKGPASMFKAFFEHASQEAVSFFIHEECVPPEKRPKTNSGRDNETQ